MNLSVVIPAHNEEHRLATALEQYGSSLSERFGEQFELIVVANGCTDGTVEQALIVAETVPQVRVIEIAEPIGKGGAVLEGFRHARGERVAFADADGATDAASLIHLADHLDQHDVVIGSRRLTNSVITTRQPLLRRVLGFLFALVIRHMFHLPFHDTQCGAKAFRLNAAHRLAQVVQETRWAFDVDLLIAAHHLGYNITEHAVVWADQDGSRLRVVATTREVLKSLWRMKRFYSGRVLRFQHERRSPRAAHKPLSILALNWRCLRHPQAGGSETNLFEQAERWVRNGHRVTVICADPGREYAASRTELVNGVQVLRMGNRFTVYLYVALFMLRYGNTFDRILDVANGVPFFAPLFTRTPSVLVMHHVHDQQWFSEFPSAVAVIGRYIEAHIVPFVYRYRPVIAVSPTTRDALVELGVKPWQIRVVYNGINLPDFQELMLLPHLQQRIVYVGRIKRYKRLERLVYAIAALRKQFPDVHLDIAGDGDARPELEQLVRQLGLQSNITIHGFVDDRTKAAILNAATVFATPSMHEGWGISVIEANAYGCPAVAYNVPGLNVAIRHGETGILAPDDMAFQRALAVLLNDASMQTRYRNAARLWATNFDWDKSAAVSLEMLYAAARRNDSANNQKADRFLLRHTDRVAAVDLIAPMVQNSLQHVA